MKIRKRTITIVETYSVTSAQPVGANPQACPICDPGNALIPIAEASALCGISLSELHRRVEQRTIHSAQMPSGELLVCLNS